MGKFQWNASQLEAIEYRGKNLLLSAAAGSGKTATLTERIIRMLRDPESDADISRMLIVTFTNDAASELKTRIAAALTEAIAENPADKRLVRQLQGLEGAAISTTHSFLLNELRPYFVQLELPPDFSVCDEATVSAMKREIMLDCVNDFFDGVIPCSDFHLLCDSLAGARDGENVDAALLSVWDDLVRLGLEPQFLRMYQPDSDFFRSDSGKYVAVRMKKISDHYTNIFVSLALAMEEEGVSSKNAPNALICADVAKELGVIAEGGYKNAREFIKNITLPKLLPVRSEDQSDCYDMFKEQKTRFKKDLDELSESYFALTPDELVDVKRQTYVLRKAVYTVIREFDRRFTEAKREKGYVDFNDIERLAVKLFCREDGSPTEAALSTAKKYDYIFIDEYQDTNTHQDMIYTAISACGSRFMVGDVKQSVYRFRGACPEIFIKYRELYEKSPEESGGKAIFMSENHRSDDTVIDFSNIVSDYMFRFSETPFEEADKLVCAKENGADGKQTEICLVEDREDMESENNEAEYVAHRISSMVGVETLKNGSKVKAGDIAILLRTGKNASVYKAALEKRGIPVKNSAAESFFNYSEVLLLLDLLIAVDNPTNDIYLAGAMKSPIFGFTMDDLVTLRGREKTPLWYSVCKYGAEKDDALANRLRAFVKRINGYREASRSMLCHKFLYMLITDTGFSALSDESGTGRLQKSIRKMYAHALSCGSGGGRLHDFVVYLKALIEEKDERESDANKDAVTIITIHRSKGLEYPVCFLCDTAREFNTMGFRKSAILDADFGLYAKLPDPSGLVSCDNPLRRATILGAKERNIEEEMRVLYVALTRPREKLIVTVKCENCDETLDEYRLRRLYGTTAYSVTGAKSFAPWIMDCAVAPIPDGLSRHVLTKCAEDYSSLEVERNSEAEEDTFNYSEAEKLLAERFEYSYTRAHLSRIPAKISVSRLKKGVLDGEGEGESNWSELPEAPVFIAGEKKATAAEMGTATHTFLQFCDLDALESDPEMELARLADKRYITLDTAKLVRMDEIETFIKSPVFRRMKSAKKMYREMRFNSMVDAYLFAENEILREKLQADGTKICVQGVIDCLFIDENGKTVLLDYKTDRLSKEELEDRALAERKLISRHSEQLFAYKRICEKIVDMKIDELLIYSLALGDSIRLTEN